MVNTPGTLWIVATPIGNLEDLSPRAQRILAEAAVVVCEDTRHTGRLLAAFGLKKPLVSLHEHNEVQVTPGLVRRLEAGESLALVSDAGTPLLSDPGYRLVRAVVDAGFPVSPVPGPSALLAALSVAGLPMDRFAFEGFLPAKSSGRLARLRGLAQEPRTLVFFESTQRLAEMLTDASACFGADRRAVVARELTKRHETLYRGTLAELQDRIRNDPDAARGEAVVVVSGAATSPADEGEATLARLLPLLLSELPATKAAKVAAQWTGVARRRVYELALRLKP